MKKFFFKFFKKKNFIFPKFSPLPKTGVKMLVTRLEVCVPGAAFRQVTRNVLAQTLHIFYIVKKVCKKYILGKIAVRIDWEHQKGHISNRFFAFH